jgi:hypothetical protein
VLAISEVTKRDLIELYGIPEEKIVVTPLAADPIYTPEGPSPDGEPYALFVGALQPRKEPTTAIEAIVAARRRGAAARARRPDKGGRADAESAAQRLGVDVQLRGHVERGELAALYRGASASSSRAATRASACRARGDGVGHAGRRDHRRRAARGGRRRGRPRRAGDAVALAAGSSAPSPTASACARRAWRRQPLLLGRDRPPHARGLPGAALSRRRGRHLDSRRPGSRAVPRLARAAGGRARADGQPRRLAVDGRARVIANDRTLGFGANINRGVAATTAPYVVASNPTSRSSPARSPR